jgi:DNA modification methylase
VSVRILQGDMREKLSELADASVDAIVTDPPYGLKFMGKGWDHGVPGVEFWTLLLRVAKPGAHLLAFGGTRTFHRLWCAVEDAGWEIRDTMMWLHGEGFPKSSNQEGEWEGWGTALKPAFEPILLARKPLVGTVAENLQAHRTGALNIDACRVETGDSLGGGGELDHTKVASDGWNRPWMQDPTAKAAHASRVRANVEKAEALGRWPANVLHDGSEEVIAAFPDLGKAGVAGTAGRHGFGTAYVNGGHKDGTQLAPTTFGDSGSAARFFWCPKASKQDRNEGLEGMPRKAVNWSRGEQSPGTFQSPNTERENENFHPTVKPTELMQYLVKLVTPRGGVVLDPFMGSGSTGKACEREGMSFVGIELDPAYIEIARRRICGVAPLLVEVV